MAGAAAAEISVLRDAVLDLAAELPTRWVAVGVGAADAVVDPAGAGTFAGYGVDVPVTLSPGTDTGATEMPLCALIAAWVRGQANPAASVEVRVYAAAHPAEAALDHGRRLRSRLDEIPESVGVLVVADGLSTLTSSAPGGHDPNSVPLQQHLDDALARGDAAALTWLPDTVVGRVAYQVLAGLCGAPQAAHERYRGAQYGVGYFVGSWTP